MSKLQKSLLAAALTIACGGAVQAAPVFAPGGDSIFFNNFENQYRPAANCTTANPCLASTTGDPTGYLRVDPTAAGNTLVNDVFVGIINVQNIQSAVSGSDVYNSVVGNRFTGYFAQTITGIAFPDTFNSTPDATTAHLTLGIGTDPFGILASGEMFRLYSDTSDFSSGGSASNVTANIALATSGTPWGGLGFGSGPDGYAYTHTDQTAIINATNTEAFFALNIINQYAGYNAGILALINDFNEAEIGGYPGQLAGQLLCSPAQIASATISCTQLVGTSEIEANTEFGTTSPWMYASNDPFRLSVPEPGTLALVGLALAGLSLRRRRAS